MIRDRRCRHHLAVDEELRFTRCDGDAVEGCVKGERCNAHDLWSSLGRQMMYFLGSITLEDVVEKRNLALAATIKQTKDRHREARASVRHYLDHNATSPAAARREGGDACAPWTVAAMPRRFTPKAAPPASCWTIRATCGPRHRRDRAHGGLHLRRQRGQQPGAEGRPRRAPARLSHRASLGAGSGQGRAGKPVEFIPVTGDGVVDLAALAKMLEGPKALVSVMLANNETGVIQPVARDRAAGRRPMARWCTPMRCRRLGKIPVNFGLLGVDLMTLSAHKLGGPRASARSWCAMAWPLEPLIHGGGQELRRRAGTENLVGDRRLRRGGKGKLHWMSARLRDRLEAALDGAVIFGARRRPASQHHLLCHAGHECRNAADGFRP